MIDLLYLGLEIVLGYDRLQIWKLLLVFRVKSPCSISFMLHRRPDLSKSVPRLDFLDVTRQLSGGPDRENVSYLLTFAVVLKTLATIYANRKWITTF